MRYLFVFFLFLIVLPCNAQKRQVVIDADTGNEVDDLYALVRILLEPSVEVTALTAAHWQTSHWSIENSMENSHRLNQQLLGEMGMNVKTLRGAPARMYDWGDRAQHSAAAYEIIRQSKQKEELTIIALGALSNVASAVFIEPDIATKLNIYWLGTTMDFDTKVLKRNDFNPLMDSFALDYLLDSEVQMNIIPVNIAAAMKIGFDEMEAKIESHFLGKYLQKRWIDHIDGDRRSRTLWDLALVSILSIQNLQKQKSSPLLGTVAIVRSPFIKVLIPMPSIKIFTRRFWLLKRSRVFLACHSCRSRNPLNKADSCLHWNVKNNSQVTIRLSVLE